jgi:hypothetical protein
MVALQGFRNEKLIIVHTLLVGSFPVTWRCMDIIRPSATEYATTLKCKMFTNLLLLYKYDNSK